MGMDLYRIKDRAYFRWLGVEWEALLDLAEQYGWVAEGTKPSVLMRENWGQHKCSKWDGGYHTNEYQRITDKDAENIADALERALPIIPDEKSDKYELRAVGKEAIEVISSEEWENLSCAEKFGGQKDYIKEFIAYLRVGGCEIH